jgi:hypothetical protein
VPADAPETAPEPEPESDVSQVDVSDTAAERAGAPKAYQVVSEERFREYERSGILPPVAVAGEDPVAAADDEAPAGSSTGSTDQR